ncbi:MAG: site-specific DNA-methyltransferase [Alphaproteobacteria bacterium]|jgi:DNA modification methylase|nr:site-specific DNA-methyltransferase [Alphaproteobacteria bacterium]
MKIFYEDDNTCLYFGDSIKILKKLSDGSIDMVFADPPYNMQLNKDLYRPDQSKVEGVGNTHWDAFSSFKDYDDFSFKWLSEVKRVLKEDGTFWVIGSYHNIFRLGKIIQDLGFWILNDIIWSKSNPMPNFKGTRFTNAHETLLWCAKNKDAKYYFHYHSMKILNDDKQMSSIWELPICSGNERVRSDDNKTLHPTQKPLSLLNRILLSSTTTESIVLDPFLGSGTTGVVAKILGRKFIGIDKEKPYLEVALNRIKNSTPEDLEKIQINKKIKKRISIGQLISEGYITTDTILCDSTSQNFATVKLDGSIETTDGEQGSIHTLAKQLTGKVINGWDFWYIKNSSQLIPLNTIRQTYFSQKFD